MKRQAAPAPDPNPVDLARLPALADHVLAGDVVQPASIPELCALLDVLKQRGYVLKKRTEWEQRSAQWLFIIVPVCPCPPSGGGPLGAAETFAGQAVRSQEA